ncbi:hypothetical protein ElyMa_004380200 [Elysia marginata]|uniref:Fibronectin type-III domain-containing protein n=1 Tax=Elysia marginata TaxID=1093978 RepID=A0AAV4H6W6_9GAST|nr:hypothetical protein ElyMa_004380200 [Elysia marginata]
MVHPADKDVWKPPSFIINIISDESIPQPGPPHCPPEVKGVDKTTCNPPDTMVVPCSLLQLNVINETTDTREGFKQHFPLPSNGLNVSSTIKNLSTDKTFLFRVAGVNKFNRLGNLF